MKKPNVTACVIMSVILLLCSVLTGCGTGETGGQADTSLVISEVMSSNASAVADFKAGNQKVMGFLVGQVMKELKGKADPKAVNQAVREKLGG